MAAERIIMGIDPGTNITGYGIIRCSGNRMELMALGVIDMSKKGGDHPDKLKKIFERILSLIVEFHPDEVAIESPFYGKNVQSMLKLGRAQGVAMAAALYREVPITEYAPKKVKMAVTGNGNASKAQVKSMLERLLNFTDSKGVTDATDGLGLAVCHFLQKGKSKSASSKKSQKKQGGWEKFLSENPERVKPKKK